MTYRRTRRAGLHAHAHVWAIAALLAAVLASGSAAAQHDSAKELERSAFEPPLACGVVAGPADLSDYASDLCRAVALALHDSTDTLAPMPLAPAEAREALSSADVLVAFGLPYELRPDPLVRFGPVVLIAEDARYAFAYAVGHEQLGEAAGWIFHALVQAEAWGFDQEAAARALDPERPAAEEPPDSPHARFLRYEARLTDQLGLRGDALRTAIAELGHHGELYQRAFGDEPGANRPVELGGLLFAPPVVGE